MTAEGGRRSDVIVLGCGVMGAAVAAALAPRGHRVLVLEQFGLGHDRGSSHGRTRLVRQAYFEDPAYVPLVRRAYDLWRQLEADTGTSLLTVTGGLTIGDPAGPAVSGTLRSARRWGIEHQVLTAAEARARFPTFAVPDGAAVVHEATMGFVRAEAAVRALVDLARRHGATVCDETGPLRVRVGPGSAAAVVEAVAPPHGRRWEAPTVVLAPGPFIPTVVPALAAAVHVERRVQYWFEPTGGEAGARRFAADVHPAYVWERTDAGPAGRLVYGFPAVDGESAVKVGFHHLGERCTAETLRRQVGDDEVEAARVLLDRGLPGAGGRLVRAEPCLYSCTPDGHFVIGRHPAHPARPGRAQVVLACGFSGHGFKFAPAVGEAVADLVEGRPPAVGDLSLFDPGRLPTGPVAGASVAGGATGPP